MESYDEIIYLWNSTLFTISILFYFAERISLFIASLLSVITIFSLLLKVSAKSNPNSVAGALAGVLREKGGAEIQAIGAGALNQAIKATAIARGFVAPSGIDLVCIPAFTDIQIEGEERTAIKLLVEPR